MVNRSRRAGSGLWPAWAVGGVCLLGAGFDLARAGVPSWATGLALVGVALAVIWRPVASVGAGGRGGQVAVCCAAAGALACSAWLAQPPILLAWLIPALVAGWRAPPASIGLMSRAMALGAAGCGVLLVFTLGPAHTGGWVYALVVAGA